MPSIKPPKQSRFLDIADARSSEELKAVEEMSKRPLLTRTQKETQYGAVNLQYQ